MASPIMRPVTHTPALIGARRSQPTIARSQGLSQAAWRSSVEPISASVASGVAGATTLSLSPGSTTLSMAAMKIAAIAAEANRIVAKLVPLRRIAKSVSAVAAMPALARLRARRVGRATGSQAH